VYNEYVIKREKEVIKMTRYEKDFRNALETMLDKVVHSFGHESKEAIRMAETIEKYENYCCYQSWNDCEAVFNSIMRRA
jgi:hypothetical protein